MLYSNIVAIDKNENQHKRRKKNLEKCNLYSF